MNNEQVELLNLMADDIAAAPESHYKYSDVLWKAMGEKITGWLYDVGVHNCQAQIYNQSFSLILGQLTFKNSMYLFYELLKLKDKYNLLSLTTALPTGDASLECDAASVNGRDPSRGTKLLTWDYLISMNTIINIATLYPDIVDKAIVVGELGAGWGRIAYYLTQVNKLISYNIFDVPPVLFISHEYLSDNLHHQHVVQYRDTREFDSFDRNFLLDAPGVRFYLSSDLVKFAPKSIDLFISVATFQEMSLEQTTAYFDDIDRLSNYFYNQQRYSEGKHIHTNGWNGPTMDFDMYPNKSNWNCLLDQDVAFNPIWFEQFYKIDPTL